MRLNLFLCHLSGKDRAKFKAADTAQTKKWMDDMEKCYVGQYTLPVTFAEHPKEDIATRQATVDKVDQQKQSFLQHGVVLGALDIRIVIRSSALYEHIFGKKAKKGQKVNLSKQDLLTFPNSGRPAETFVGDHSATALKQLATEHPSRADFKQVPMKVYITNGTSDEIVKMLRAVGTIDNIVKDKRVAMSASDWLIGMRAYYQQKLTEHSGDVTKAKKDTINYFVTVTNTSRGNVDNYVRAVSFPDGCYNAICAILSGQCKSGNSKKFRPPKSPAFLNCVSGINHVILQGFLENIVKGIWTMQEFQRQAKQLRGHYLLNDLVATQLYDTFGQKGKTWSDMKAEHPDALKLFNDAFFDKWAPMTVSNSSTEPKTPEGFLPAVANLIKVYKDRSNALAETKVNDDMHVLFH